MLTLAIANANPAGAEAVTAFGVIVLAVVAAVVVGVWIAVARQFAHRDDADTNEDIGDSGLEALRHQHLAVQPESGRQATEVVELVPDDPGGQTASSRAESG